MALVMVLSLRDLVEFTWISILGLWGWGLGFRDYEC